MPRPTPPAGDAPSHELSIRSFLAIDLPPELRSALGRLTRTLGRETSAFRWVAEENLHLTIKFFGQLAEADLQRLSPVLVERASRLPRFACRLGGLGTFPPGRSPKVVWVGVTEGADRLVDLHRAVEDAVEEAGIAARDTEPFTPHVTIGRAGRSRRRLVSAADFPDTLVPAAATAVFAVEALTLTMSELTPAGPIYSPITKVPLGG